MSVRGRGKGNLSCTFYRTRVGRRGKDSVRGDTEVEANLEEDPVEEADHLNRQLHVMDKNEIL